MNRRRELLWALLLYVALDVLSARLLRSTALWGPEALERRYRVAHPVYHHDLVPKVDLTAYWGDIAYPLRTNSLGFRDSAASTVALYSARPRLLLIGDSFTEGLGVAFPETYAGRLQRHLAGCGVEVLNAGVMSYAPSIYYAKVRHLLRRTRLRIDYVVVALDLSDIGDEANSYRLDWLGNVVDRPTEPDEHIRHVLKEWSLLFHIVDLLRDGLRARIANPVGFPDWTTDSVLYASYGAAGLRHAAARMDGLLALLRAEDIGLAIVVYPYPAHVVSANSDSRQERFWGKWAAARGVPFFSLFSAFQTASGPEQAVREHFIEHDVHWNPQGHALVARSLLQAGLADTLLRDLAGGSARRAACS